MSAKWRVLRDPTFESSKVETTIDPVEGNIRHNFRDQKTKTFLGGVEHGNSNVDCEWCHPPESTDRGSG